MSGDGDAGGRRGVKRNVVEAQVLFLNAASRAPPSGGYIMHQDIGEPLADKRADMHMAGQPSRTVPVNFIVGQ